MQTLEYTKLTDREIGIIELTLCNVLLMVQTMPTPYAFGEHVLSEAEQGLIEEGHRAIADMINSVIGGLMLKEARTERKLRALIEESFYED